MNKKRISKNESRLDNIYSCVVELGKSLDTFKTCQKDIDLLNKYYGSNEWFTDREDFDNEEKPDIKAGVLSEDAIWNLNENINQLMREMKSLLDRYQKNHTL